MNGIEKAANVIDEEITKESYGEIFQRALKDRPPEEILGRALVYAIREMTGGEDDGISVDIDNDYCSTSVRVRKDSGTPIFKLRMNFDSYRLQSWLSGVIASAIHGFEYKIDELKEALSSKPDK